MRCLLLFGAAALGLRLFGDTEAIIGMIGGMGIGVAVMALSRISNGSIGMGDGMLLIVTGIYLGGAANMELLFIGLTYAAVWSLGMIILAGKKKRREIPFVPFLLAAYLTILAGGAL